MRLPSIANFFRNLPDLPHPPNTQIKGRTGDSIHTYSWPSASPEAGDPNDPNARRKGKARKLIQANRLDDVSIEDLDRLRFYPVVRDSINTQVAPLKGADFHFVCARQDVAEAAQQLLASKVKELLSIMPRGAMEFGRQSVEMVPEPQFDVTVTLGQGEGEKVEKFYPFMWGVKHFNSFEPKYTRILIHPITGKFAGIRQYVSTRNPTNRDIKRPYAMNLTNDMEFDKNYGVAKSKGALPWVEAAVALLDSMVQYGDTMANPYKEVRYPFGQSVTADPVTGAKIRVDNGDRALEIAEAFESGSAVCVPSDPWVFNGQASTQPKWEVDFKQPASATADYVSMIEFLNGMIRLVMCVPEMASGGEAPESGTYNLGEVQIKLFLTNLQSYLDNFEVIIDEQLLDWWTTVNFGASCPRCKIKFKPIDLSTALMLLQALLENVKTGEPLVDAEGNLLYVDWAKLGQDNGLPLIIKKANKAAQDLAATVAQRLKDIGSPDSGQESNDKIPAEGAIDPSAKLEEWEENKHPRDEDGRFTASEFVEQAQKNRTWQGKYKYGATNSKAESEIAKHLGTEPIPWSIIVDADHARHVQSRHGSETGGQVSVTPADYEFAQDVINDHDSAELVAPHAQGHPQIRFSKRYNGTTYVVVGALPKNQRRRENELRISTLYKHKT